MISERLDPTTQLYAAAHWSKKVALVLVFVVMPICLYWYLVDSFGSSHTEMGADASNVQFQVGFIFLLLSVLLVDGVCAKIL